MPSEREHRSRTIQRGRIMKAISTRDHELLRASIVDMGTHIDDPEKTFNQTPLSAAAWAGDAEACRILVEEGNASVSRTGLDNGATPLIVAAELGHLGVVQYLTSLALAVDKMRADRGNALYTAAKMGHLPVVRHLLEEAGARVDVPTQNGRTPILVAAQEGHVDILTYLISNADSRVNVRTTRAGATPLYVASHEGHLEAVKVLLDVGKADVNVSTSRSGRTPLHAAAAQGHLDVVRCLIEAGADPCMASSPSGQTPLISACSAGQAAVAQYLMSQGANVNAARANGVTALYVSAYGGFGDLVRVLLQQGADPNRAAYGGDETPLHVAVRKAHLDVVQALKEYGENLEVNPRTRDGNTPLHFAARHGSPSVVLEMLTLDGVDINAKSDDGSTPLHAAACTGSLEMVSSFLARGADANRPRHTDLLTPVGCAAHFGWGDVVKELAVRGGATTFNLDRSANWSRREATSACIQELLRVHMLPWCRVTSRNKLVPVQARKQAWTILLCLRRHKGGFDGSAAASLDMALHIMQFFRVGDLVAPTSERVQPPASSQRGGPASLGFRGLADLPAVWPGLNPEEPVNTE